MTKHVYGLAVALLAMVVATTFLAAPAGAQSETKICKARTKTMGCTLEEGVTSLLGASRANTVAAGGPLPGKCQIDSPGITPVRETAVVTGVFCDDPALGDTGDHMIALCKTASTAVRANCKTVCSKLEKIDPTTGDPVPETPCHHVVDRTVVTTATDQLGVMENENGQQGCGLVCTASIVCVCDP